MSYPFPLTKEARPPKMNPIVKIADKLSAVIAHRDVFMFNKAHHSTRLDCETHSQH